MRDRRSVYFVFQGLLTAALLGLFLVRARGFNDPWRLAGLVALLLLPLVVMRFAPREAIDEWWFQTGFFMVDAAAATIALYWRQPLPAAYLVYLFIIFGTALTRNYRQSVALGVVSCALYLIVYWRPGSGLAREPDFWLRLQVLIITTTLLSLLSRDAQKTQKEQQERLVQAERLATLGRVAGEVAHRIKGPLTTIRVNAEVLARRFGRSKEALEQLAEIEEEVDRCKSILKSLLDLGRIEEMDLAPIDLRDPLRQALRSAETQMKSKAVSVSVTGLDDGAFALVGDRSLLQEAFSALLQNALEACERGGHVSVRAERGPGGRWARVAVEDDGRGISEADLERIFLPFFTTKGTEGSGLGLSAAQRIAQKHGGLVEARSDGPGRGARFLLRLPLS
jgi:signal transduction histidine kinase